MKNIFYWLTLSILFTSTNMLLAEVKEDQKKEDLSSNTEKNKESADKKPLKGSIPTIPVQMR